MRARDTHEAHRVATPLELLFDLCFVVAVAQAAASLHHAIAAGHAGPGLLHFVQVFFAVWWAWMNFTWYASAYDTDDVWYRLKVLVQMVGVLVLAAGVPRLSASGDGSIVTLGYAIMRVSLIACWLRAAAEDADPERARTARRYAFGIAVCEVAWLAMLFLPRDTWGWVWFAMLPLELGVPIWAEKTGATTWHPHHIVERYSLMTLIVIGESVLAATLAVQAAVDGGSLSWLLGCVIAGAVLVLFSAWWIYFAEPPTFISHTNRWAFFWGYGHYFVFAALAAMGAGLAFATDSVVGGGPHWIASAAVAIPIAVFLAAQWIFVIWKNRRGAGVNVAYGLAIACVLGSIAIPVPALPVGVIMIALTIATRGRAMPAHH